MTRKDKQPADHADLEQPERFLPVAQRAVDRAKRAGADVVDAAVSVSRDLAVVIEKSSIKTSELGLSRRLSIRAYCRGGMGYVSANGFEDQQIDDLADRAVATARLASPDPDFVDLPRPETQADIPDTFDDNVLAIGPDAIVQWACENIHSAQAVCSDVILSGEVGVGASAGALVSSNGVSVVQHGTSVHLGVFAVVKDDTNVGSFADYRNARFLDDFDLEPFAGDVTKRAQEYQSPRQTQTRQTTLVLGPLPAFGLLGAVAAAANGESIQRGRSLLADKLNETIAADLLTITDNGLIAKGLSSGAYDGEGAPRRIVRIVDRGRFVAQLHNSYTAHKAKVPNTGHGLRTGGVTHTNLQPQLGGLTAQKIIEQVDDGVYLELGSLSPDLTSGDISTHLDFAFKIERGVLAYPLANTMVAGNLLDLLKNIDAISSDYRYEPGNVMPTIRIRNVQISAQAEQE